MAVTQQEIESWLWEAANILRGPVDPANLRDFVFPLLFLKRLSDTWDEEQAKAVAKFGEKIDAETAADFHTFKIPKGCHWSDLRRAAENHGVVIQNIMQKIEVANPERLAEIFGSAPWADNNKMPRERLERLIDHFSQRELSPSKISNDLLGGGYEYLLKRFSDESATSAGQFFTPRSTDFALNFLKANCGITSPALLSSPLLVTALAYFANKRGFSISPEEAGELRRYLLIANAKGRYSRASSESVLDQDLGILRDGGGVSILFERLISQVGRIDIQPGDLVGRNQRSSLFKMMFIAFKSKSAQDWKTSVEISLDHGGQQDSLQFHHIFLKRF